MSSSGPQDSDKDCSTDMSPGGPQYSGKGCSPDKNPLLRDRAIDYFVNESYFLDVHLSPIVTSELPYVGFWVRRLVSISMPICMVLLFYGCHVLVLAFKEVDLYNMFVIRRQL